MFTFYEFLYITYHVHGHTNICNNYFLTSWFIGCKNFWSDCMRLKDARFMGGASTHAIYKAPREIPAVIDF